MRVKISYDEGSTFVAECDLTDCFPDFQDDMDYFHALDELSRVGRFWAGGGAAPLALLMRVS